MKTERYNIFSKVHHGLRVQLMQTGLKIQAADFSRSEKARPVFEQIEKATARFCDYLEKDMLVYHHIAPMAPYIVVLLEKSQEKNRNLMTEIHEQIRQYGLNKTPAARLNIGAEIRSMFFEFTASVLQSISKEEMIINDLLWDEYTDKELADLDESMKWSAEEKPAQAGVHPVLNGEKAREGEHAVQRGSHHAVFRNPIPLLGKTIHHMARSIIPPDQWDSIHNYFSPWPGG
ncbi:MAG: hypothetical protein IPP73_07255 [Chitinophagaceae bacterium]|nr:hypothetical protein [Chitinophagaceae bacterium]